jgi:hypothetical protein
MSVTWPWCSASTWPITTVMGRTSHGSSGHLGYTRIQGELLNLGYKVGAFTVRGVLKGLWIPPAP